jgi:hypothetical protein
MTIPLSTFERIHFECSDEVLCARCQTPLDRHQPDVDLPDRLLGTCCGCRAWYLIDDRLRIMFSLPDVRALRSPPWPERSESH